MRYLTERVQFDMDRESVVTLGKFDGLHRGHQKLLKKVQEIGLDGYETVVFSFDISPLIRLGHGSVQNILTNAERLHIMEKSGIDTFIECPFVEEIIRMEPENFVREILVKQLKAAYIVVGPDFCFGHERRGTVKLLQQLGPRYGFMVEVVEKEKENSREISSSFIREELQKGNIALVNKLLGYPYFVEGSIVHGRKLGRTMGLPTINQIPEERKLLPPKGVYVSRTYIEQETYEGITNIGCKPTVEGAFIGVETFLFDCDKNLYEKNAKVELFQYQRPEKKFSSIEELKKQIKKDEADGRKFFQK